MLRFVQASAEAPIGEATYNPINFNNNCKFNPPMFDSLQCSHILELTRSVGPSKIVSLPS